MTKKYDEREMPFLEHLEELRWRLLKSIISVFIFTVLCFTFSDQLLEILLYPGKQLTPPVPLQVLKVQTMFMIKLEIAVIGGVIISLPVIFYQLWMFLAPGLLAKERSLIPVIVFASVLCFLLGAVFAYFIILPYTLTFFLSLAPFDIENKIAIDFYISFLLRIILVFGIVFELPMLSFLLSKIGILTPAFMRKYRKYAIVGAFIVGAILTPPDPTSQILLAIPMLLLYEVSIFISAIFAKKRLESDSA